MPFQFLRKYNEEATINFSLFKIDGIDLRSDATFAAGDVKIMKDDGAEANVSNLPADEGQGYSILLTAAELTAKRLVLYIVDQTSTKVWLDETIIIETYGHASAMHAFNLDYDLSSSVETLNLKSLVIANTTGVGMSVSGGSGNPGLSLTGSTNAPGLQVYGGPTGNGAVIQAGANAGNGLLLWGPAGHGAQIQGTVGNGLRLVGSLEGLLAEGGTHGIFGKSTGTGNGIRAYGKTAGQSGALFTAEDGHGLECAGVGVGRKDIDANELDTLQTTSNTINSNVLSIQNNTKFTSSLPNSLMLPEAPNVKWARINVQIRDTSGNPEDIDDNEVALQIIQDDTLIPYSRLFHDNGAVTPAVSSITFIPNFYVMNRIGVGLFELYFEIQDDYPIGAYTFTFRYKENIVTQQYSRSMTILPLEAVTSIELLDNIANKTIIAKAMKEIDLSGTVAVADSIFEAIVEQIQIIINKLPSGNISDFGLSTTVESQSISTLLSMLMSMFDGKYVIDTETGRVTFYRRDNVTPLTVVQVTETSRERVELPS